MSRKYLILFIICSVLITLIIVLLSVTLLNVKSLQNKSLNNSSENTITGYDDSNIKELILNTKLSLDRIESKFHKEKENEFLQRNKQRYYFPAFSKTVALTFSNSIPSSYDYSNKYIYTLFSCYLDLSGDCVGPEVTPVGIEITQNETISSVDILTVPNKSLNGNLLYFVTIRSNLGTRYAIFYPKNISSAGTTTTRNLSKYAVLTSNIDADEVFTPVVDNIQDNILAYVVRNEDVPEVKYHILFDIVEATLNIKWEKQY